MHELVERNQGLVWVTYSVDSVGFSGLFWVFESLYNLKETAQTSEEPQM